MADIYRKTSLERISNPDQLDRELKVTSPFSWIALIAVALIIAALIIWLFVGTLPSTLPVYGIVSNPTYSVAVYSSEAGTFNCAVSENDYVKQQDLIGTVISGSSSSKNRAPLDGKVTKILVENDTEVFPGTELMRISPDDFKPGESAVVLFVPQESVGKIKNELDKEVYIYPDSYDSQNDKSEAHIVDIGEYPVNIGNMQFITGDDNMTAELFYRNGPVVAVVCKFDGANVPKRNTLVSAKIITEKERPINLLFKGMQGGAE
ncbi:MAG: HlyD family efflux transporter periplasmic adaptor subunit [Clostridia bacterium]|nr:HlyD family efflux transporter periplasmic adaptor subunit [Clostridia bacterium]